MIPNTHRILVVDDDPDMRNLLRDILEDQQYSVALAQNGQEALNKLDSGEFNVFADRPSNERDGRPRTPP